MSDELAALEFDLGPNEASGLESFGNQRVLANHGWDLAFWAVLDDVEVADAIGVLGHRRDEPLDRGWEVERLHTTVPDDTPATEDAEAVARHAGWIWVFGSHFGSKDGPLQAKRQFVARFREADVDKAFGGDDVALQVRRTGLADGLHRVVNDGLRDHDVACLASASVVAEAFLSPDDDVDDRMRPAEGDRPINIEGAAFLHDGKAILGLRWPVHESGRPLLVVVDGLVAWMDADPDDAPLPTVTAVHVLDAVGADGDLAGVRDLALAGGCLHVVTGNIDSRDKGSVLLQAHPEGAETVNTHVVCDLPAVDADQELDALVRREFPDLPRIEGIAIDLGHVFYVSDEDEGVDVRFTRFFID